MKLIEYYEKFKQGNPQNLGMTLERIGEIILPDMRGANSHGNNNNKGATRREFATACIMGRLHKRGLVKRPRNWKPSEDRSLWCWNENPLKKTTIDGR